MLIEPEAERVHQHRSQRGQITEYGTHDELIARGGTYSSLYTMQAQQYK